MKILIISKVADAAGLAYQLYKEGHTVQMWTQDRQYNNCLVGIIERVLEWKSLVPKSDLIICDMVGFSSYRQLFDKFGKPVLCCSALGDRLELDRDFSCKAMLTLGLDFPQSVLLTSPADMQDCLDAWEDGYVVKPNGNLSPIRTTVCHDPETFRWVFGNLPTNQTAIAQRIVKGIEISTEGWFNGRDWIYPFNHTFEEKRLLSGGLGPNTGCMGNVVITTPGNKLTETVLQPLTPMLKKAGYRGPIDVNCIVNESTAYALEFTTRFGYDALEALMGGLKEPVADLMFETATGVKRRMDITTDYMIAVRVVQPPYPYADQDLSNVYAGNPISGITELDLPHIYLSDLMQDEDNVLRSSGSDGVLLKATAFGRDVKEAQKRVYKTIHNLKGLDLYYRTDIGNRVPSDMSTLKNWGWL